ncbi:MAG TPA: beta-ketoacyl synthase chain length factor [Gammaproteobacteria bacterium]|nr:beta-ketoacyl synthase chain length factor [Gammaproteobacteria bacterium]
METQPALHAMPALLRRRASSAGKKALEVAYRCLGDNTQDIPIIFASRHGECQRSVDLLIDQVQKNPISPTAFSLSTHNATSGLFSIARQDHENSLAIAAGQSTIEHAVIEACGLLADGESAVLLIAHDNALPEIFNDYQDCNEQDFAWAWLIQSPQRNQNSIISLSWSANKTPEKKQQTAGIEIAEFFVDKNSVLERNCDNQQWRWSHVTPEN